MSPRAHRPITGPHPLPSSRQVGRSKSLIIIRGWRFVGFALIVSVFLLPGISIGSNLPGFRIEYLIQIVVIIFIIVAFLFGRPVSVEKYRISLIFLLFFLTSLLSILSTDVIFGNSIILNDFMVLPMLVTYLVTMYISSRMTMPGAVFFVRSMIVISLSVAAFGVLQKYNLLGINIWATPLYTPEDGSQAAHSLHAVIAGEVWARVGGTHGDPRHYGFLLVAAMSVPLASLLILQNGLPRLLAIIAVALTALALTYTSSRTAIFSAAICLTVAVCLYLLKMRHLRTLVLLAMAAALCGPLAVTSISSSGGYLATRLLETDSEYFTVSSQPRITDLVTPFAEAVDQPYMWLLGMGPSKSVLLGSAHSEIGYLFRRYGVPGLIFVFSLIWLMLQRSLRLFFRTADNAEAVTSLAVLLVAVNWLITMLAESIIHDPQRMGANMIFLGALLGLSSKSNGSPPPLQAPMTVPATGPSV